MAAPATGKQAEEVLADSKALVELLSRLQDELTRAADKNDSLLEAIESSEARASRESGVEVRGGAQSQIRIGYVLVSSITYLVSEL